MWLPDEPESGSKSLIRFRSCDSTLVDPAQHDDDDYDFFSQFICSPSPDCVSTIDKGDAAAVDERESPRPSRMPVSQGSSSSCLSLGTDHPQDAHSGTRSKLQIRLRVEPPKPKITLRLSAPKKCQAKKPQQQKRPRKKRSTRRR